MLYAFNYKRHQIKLPCQSCHRHQTHTLSFTHNSAALTCTTAHRQYQDIYTCTHHSHTEHLLHIDHQAHLNTHCILSSSPFPIRSFSFNMHIYNTFLSSIWIMISPFLSDAHFYHLIIHHRRLADFVYTLFSIKLHWLKDIHCRINQGQNLIHPFSFFLKV